MLSIIRKIVGYLASAVLSWMIILAATQLLLRWFFSTGISWADIQLRQMVLLTGLLGGVLAASENRHIRIDLLDHFGNPRIKKILHLVMSILATGCTFFLGYISISFIISERESGTLLRNFFFGIGIPQWYIELAMPICFFLMGIFFLTSVIFPEKEDNSEEKLT
ncbi:MAG: TRAP transporter small permease subunit [Calditrichaeota bacterium]|nr:TRAP transporter small permease subunit [Calditrichota bacterium]